MDRRQIALNVLSNVGEPPCTECRLAAKCKAERMACAQFAAYVWSGTWSARQEHVPSKELFQRVYVSTDKPMRKQNHGGGI